MLPCVLITAVYKEYLLNCNLGNSRIIEQHRSANMYIQAQILYPSNLCTLCKTYLLFYICEKLAIYVLIVLRNIREKISSGTPSSSHVPSKSPQQSQTTTEDKAKVQEMIWVHDVLLKPIICTGFTVFLHGQEKTVWISRHGHLLLFYHCCMNVSMIWSNKMDFTLVMCGIQNINICIS